MQKMTKLAITWKTVGRWNVFMTFWTSFWLLCRGFRLLKIHFRKYFQFQFGQKSIWRFVRENPQSQDLNNVMLWFDFHFRKLNKINTQLWVTTRGHQNFFSLSSSLDSSLGSAAAWGAGGLQFESQWFQNYPSLLQSEISCLIASSAS